jgi:hypothetical protein
MLPDHDHFSGRVIQVGLRRVPGPGSELNFALLSYHPAEQARGTR